jgi:hypothetical protein
MTTRLVVILTAFSSLAGVAVAQTATAASSGPVHWVQKNLLPREAKIYSEVYVSSDNRCTVAVARKYDGVNVFVADDDNTGQGIKVELKKRKPKVESRFYRLEKNRWKRIRENLGEIFTPYIPFLQDLPASVKASFHHIYVPS